MPAQIRVSGSHMPRGQNPPLRAANGTASGRRSPIGLITALALLMATGTVAAQDAANAVFRALEDRLLEAEKLSFSFDIRAVGPVPAVLVGNAVIGPEETARLVADGSFAGDDAAIRPDQEHVALAPGQRLAAAALENRASHERIRPIFELQQVCQARRQVDAAGVSCIERRGQLHFRVVDDQRDAVHEHALVVRLLVDECDEILALEVGMVRREHDNGVLEQARCLEV